jgi:hypothetical protein
VNGDPVIPHGQRTIDRWFDTSVFSQAPLGTFSTLGRNPLSGPGWNQWDVSFMKRIRFAEGRQLELRAPATFGRITSARNERTFMLGARIQF